MNESDLVEALRAGTIAGAGLDVYAQEPVDPANPLLSMDNVLATPHIAGCTRQNYEGMGGFSRTTSHVQTRRCSQPLRESGSSAREMKEPFTLRSQRPQRNDLKRQEPAAPGSSATGLGCTVSLPMSLRNLRISFEGSSFFSSSVARTGESARLPFPCVRQRNHSCRPVCVSRLRLCES